jgi:hypothetical protein
MCAKRWKLTTAISPRIADARHLQAIDKLEVILDEGMKAGTTGNVFVSKEYTDIYV